LFSSKNILFSLKKLRSIFQSPFFYIIFPLEIGKSAKYQEETVLIKCSILLVLACFFWFVTCPYTSSVKTAVAWPKSDVVPTLYCSLGISVTEIVKTGIRQAELDHTTLEAIIHRPIGNITTGRIGED